MSPSTATEKPFVLRWGILGTGWISGSFVKDLTLDPAGRSSPLDDGLTVSHAITAVASRGLDKAKAFVAEMCPDGGAAQIAGLLRIPVTPYGSWQEVVECKDVDCIYVGSPNTSHYEHAHAALLAGKHVLVEKPVSLNVAELRTLHKLATAKSLFLMEAVWTRFFPLTFKLQELLFIDKAIGNVRHVQANFAMNFLDHVSDSHRLLNPDLAGGVLLDLGPYPMMWTFLTLFHHPDNHRTPPTNVTCSMMRHPRTGVDIFTTFVMDFPSISARADCHVNIASVTSSDVCVRITGTAGQIIIPMGCSRPDRLVVRRYVGEDTPMRMEYEEETLEFPIDGMGLHWEADEVARCIRGEPGANGCSQKRALMSE